MKRFILLFTVIFPVAVFSQKVITIDLSSNYDTLRQNLIIGGNDFYVNTGEYLKNQGIELIRLHDNNRYITDYCTFTDFWLRDSIGNFVSKNPDFDPLSEASYYWHDFDSVVAMVLDSDFSLFMRLGVSYPIHAPYEPIEPPTNVDDSLSFSNFASLCAHTVMHFNQGWDSGHYYNLRYWEVWNEPANSLFWSGRPIDYYQMYKAVVDSIKSHNPDVLVGGVGALPTTTIGLNPQYREDFINFCSTNNLPLDFYSWHLYYYYGNPYAIKTFADTIRSILDANGYPDAQIIISEINFDLHNVGSLPDSSYGAAFYSSLILSALQSNTDALIWYPSVFDIMTPMGGINLTKTYYVLWALNDLITQNKYLIPTNSDEVIEDSWDSDTTNLMSVTVTGEDTSEISLFVSNMKSEHSQFEIQFENLNWTGAKKIKISKYIMTETQDFQEQVELLDYSPNASLLIDDVEAPSVFMIKATPVYSDNVEPLNQQEFLISNPVNDVLHIYKYPKNASSLVIYDFYGKVIKQLPITNEINVSDLNAGFYLLQLKTEHSLKYVKFIKY